MKVNKNKWVVSATTAALVASAIVPVASAANFSDIDNNDHKDAILALADAGIVSGYTDGTFKPNAVVTRGNVTKLLGKWLVSEGYKIPEDFEKEARFTDLPVTTADQELVKYAALVKDEGVFKGSNDKLMQANNMTREQMALVLVRAINTVYGVDLVADYKEAKFESKITDLEKATAIENREAITALEFAKLTDVTEFRPKNSLTRGQFASFLNRTIVNLAKEEVVLTVKEVTVKDATTLEVTLSDDTKHAVTLENALPKNKETEVDFEIGGNKYSAKVTYKVANVKVDSVTVTNATTINAKLDTAELGKTVEDFTVLVDGTEVTPTAVVADATGANYTLTIPTLEGKKGNVSVNGTATTYDFEALKVENVSAINTTELQVSLNKASSEVKASDFIVTVNGVEKTVTATVTNKIVKLQLSVPLVDGDVVVVKAAADSKVTGEGKVTYATEKITTVEAVATEVYADKAGQELKLKVNGKEASVSDLAKQGYTVTFQATETVFDGSTTSSTGLLDATDLDTLYQANTKSFKYKVSLQKDNEVVTSANVTVAISQEDLTAATTVKSHNITVTTAGSEIVSLTSGKLVTGEIAEIDELIADLQDGRKNVNLVNLTGANIEFESSDVTIASVDATGEITAGLRAGKVTITVKSAGKVIKEIQLEVVKKARELTTATYAGTPVKLTNNAQKTITLVAKDQYGDTYNTAAIAGDLTRVEATASGKVITGTVVNNGASPSLQARGIFTVDITADAAEVGSGTLRLNNDSKTVISVPVSVTKEVGLLTQKINKDANVIDLNPDSRESSIEFSLENTYNNNFKEYQDLDGYTIEVYDATKPTTPIYDIDVTSTTTSFEINAAALLMETGSSVADLAPLSSSVSYEDVFENSEVGTALVVIKDTATGTEIAKTNFTIKDTSANATAATFNTAVQFTDGNETGVLTLDDILSNVSTTASPYDGVLRYEFSSTPDRVLVYFDKGANVSTYSYDDGDILVGVIEGIGITAGDTITFAQGSTNKYLANEITLEHSLAAEGNKAQFNFYKRGDVSVGKAVYTKVVND